MKFIKKFEKDTEYVSYRNGNGYIKPNVSLSRDTKEVHYNYPIWDANGHEYVDLGLPSGTLWATMNIGALKPSDYGKYFQWGDTSGYTSNQIGKEIDAKHFTWTDYKWRSSGDSDSNVAFSKYTTISATLELEDDAAQVNWGGDWHMPTREQLMELTSAANVTTAWTTSDGVSGMTFTSKKDASKHIFIPSAGYAQKSSVHDSKSSGYVWSSMLSGSDKFGTCLKFVSGGSSFDDYFRYNGYSVRGVLG